MKSAAVKPRAPARIGYHEGAELPCAARGGVQGSEAETVDAVTRAADLNRYAGKSTEIYG